MARKRFITRSTVKPFTYFLDGQPLRDKEEIAYLNSLAIPPAWKDVRISSSRRARVLATGIDSAGRTQYIYHPVYRAQQETEKFNRLIEFATRLPRLRRQVHRDLDRKRFDKRKVMACAISLLDRTYFRIGNSVYTEQHESYGLTTLRSKHITINKHTVTFDFIGKSGQRQNAQLNDKRLSQLLKQLDDMPGYELFRYYDKDGRLQPLNNTDINTYIKDIMGETFSAKDFRTWGGTLYAATELYRLERPSTARERKKAITNCVKKVATVLGNTTSITRKSYIDPRLLEAYVSSERFTPITALPKSRPSAYFSENEHRALQLLKKIT